MQTLFNWIIAPFVISYGIIRWLVLGIQDWIAEDEIKRPFKVLGWIWLCISSISLLTFWRANELNDSAVEVTALSIGLAYFVIGVLFVSLDLIFNEQSS